MLKLFSLRGLQTADSGVLIDQLCLRAQLQLDALNRIPNTRQVTILTSLYSDSVQTTEYIREAYQLNPSFLSSARRADADGRLQSLCIRHGLCTETLSDLYLEMIKRNVSHREDFIRTLLARQSSFTSILEQLASRYSSKYPDFIKDESLLKLCKEVKFNAISLAEHQANWSPRIQIHGDAQLALMIPSRIQFVLLEILKNALSATIARHTEVSSRLLAGEGDIEDLIAGVPPVQVTVSTAEVWAEAGDVGRFHTLSVRDAGVGIPPNKIPHIFKFLHFSTRKASEMVNQQVSYQPQSAPLQGLGAGLCLSRIYLQQFGGDITLQSGGEGRGSECTIRIAKDTTVTEQFTM